MFGGYILVHLAINATLIEGVRHGAGPTVYQLQVDKIHSLPLLEVVEWTFIMLPLLFHTFYGIYIVATGQPNVARYGYGKNWLYLLQRITAIILVAFIAFHVMSFKGWLDWLPGVSDAFLTELKFVPVDHATQSTVNHMHAAWWVGWIVYPIGIVAATIHLANGFWAAGITWGLTVSRAAQQRWGLVCLGIFMLTTACGFAALGSALLEEPRPIPVQAHGLDIDHTPPSLPGIE